MPNEYLVQLYYYNLPNYNKVEYNILYYPKNLINEEFPFILFLYIHSLLLLLFELIVLLNILMNLYLYMRNLINYLYSH